MYEYFGVRIEFERFKVDRVVENLLTDNQKGYVCVIDGNVLACSTKDDKYKSIINGATVNVCDGNSIAVLASIIYKRKFKTYNGPELFSKFVKKNYVQFFIGNTTLIHQNLMSKFANQGFNTGLMNFLELPFLQVDEFDYKSIANSINNISPDIIWVSLGAPKQELFINNLYPLINKGVLFAVGAAFNFYLNEEQSKRAPKWMLNFKIEWLYRSIKEPKRIGVRAIKYLIILPKIIYCEFKKVYFKS